MKGYPTLCFGQRKRTRLSFGATSINILALTHHAEDYTLMAPFGGTPTHGFDGSTESRARMASFFKSGTLEQEVVATYNSG
jgi:hypothetical protein